MSLKFEETSKFSRGVILDILEDAYSFDLRYTQCWKQNWQEADDFLFDNEQIADKYCFVTILNGEAIGFIVWDPRNMPTYVEVGHNCIRTKYKGKGYGKLQLREAINRISKAGAEKIIVTTNEGLIPAQKNYEGVGFQLKQKRTNYDNPEIAGNYMDYELIPSR